MSARSASYSNGARVASLRGIEKDYSGNRVFDGLDLDLEPANFYALLGRNGSGKSTLLRILAHREAVAKGAGLVLGVVLNRDFGRIVPSLAYVSEENPLPPEASVLALCTVAERANPGWDEALFQELAQGFGLDLGKRVAELSRGQLTQLRLLLSLAYRPALILLDEITCLLDAPSRLFLLRFLSERVREGATVLLSTNLVEDVLGHATALILLGNKHVRLNAPASAIACELKKVVRPQGLEHSVFSGSRAIEVGATAAGDVFLVPAEEARREAVPPELYSSEPITPAEILLYLTRLAD